jgi:hypothetical protein
MNDRKTVTTKFDTIKRGILDQDIQTVADAIEAVDYLKEVFRQINQMCSLNKDEYIEGFHEIGRLSSDALEN